MPATLLALLAAGIAGEIAFELYAFGASPLLFGLTLEPARLVAGLAGKVLGLELSYGAAFAIHVLAGAVLFPLGYLAFRRIVPIGSPVLAGLAWGLVLWAIAQGLLAPLVGRPPFMGFGAYTWSSLLAHPVLAVVTAVVFHRLSGAAVNPSRTARAGRS